MIGRESEEKVGVQTRDCYKETLYKRSVSLKSSSSKQEYHSVRSVHYFWLPEMTLLSAPITNLRSDFGSSSAGYLYANEAT